MRYTGNIIFCNVKNNQINNGVVELVIKDDMITISLGSEWYRAYNVKTTKTNRVFSGKDDHPMSDVSLTLTSITEDKIEGDWHEVFYTKAIEDYKIEIDINIDD